MGCLPRLIELHLSGFVIRVVLLLDGSPWPAVELHLPRMLLNVFPRVRYQYFIQITRYLASISIRWWCNILWHRWITCFLWLLGKQYSDHIIHLGKSRQSERQKPDGSKVIVIIQIPGAQFGFWRSLFGGTVEYSRYPDSNSWVVDLASRITPLDRPPSETANHRYLFETPP
jgi:hypothetical protein